MINMMINQQNSSLHNISLEQGRDMYSKMIKEKLGIIKIKKFFSAPKKMNNKKVKKRCTKRITQF